MEMLDTTLPRLVTFGKSLLHDVKDFYLLTDPAHRIDHIEWVMANVFTIYTQVDLGLHDESQMEAIFKQALIAAAYHDIYSHERKYHHFMSFQYVLDNPEIFIDKHKLSKIQMYNVAYACMEHRGSWKGPYHSLVSEIVAAADRGIPDQFDMTDAVKRSYLFARTTGGKSIADAIQHSVEHLKDKYGKDGYGRVPNWYKDYWAPTLKIRSGLIEALTVHSISESDIAKWEGMIKETANGQESN